MRSPVSPTVACSQWTKRMYYKYGSTLFFAAVQTGFVKTIC